MCSKAHKKIKIGHFAQGKLINNNQHQDSYSNSKLEKKSNNNTSKIYREKKINLAWVLLKKIGFLKFEQCLQSTEGNTM